MHIDKKKVRITALVDRFRIVADMHSYHGARLLDLVNVKGQAFIPLTDAEVYSLEDGKLLHKTPFLGINRDQVKFFYPMEPDQLADKT